MKNGEDTNLYTSCRVQQVFHQGGPPRQRFSSMSILFVYLTYGVTKYNIGLLKLV